MTQNTLLVCTLCQLAETEAAPEGLSEGQLLFNQLKAGLETSGIRDRIHLQPVRCMGACDRSCMVAFTAPQKLTFILHQLSPTDSIPELLQFCQQYAAAPDGRVPYKDRPEAVKQGIHAVLPPLPIA
ncbi:DUF1636 domain-containing protein [Pantanalinema rosaneae CENA516]|uniref:DUF1636 domain-containing protein n=1 Tax=Pantanalinema rosaneae TaxID=1620701 RepID=UPI003D6DD0DB